MLRSQRLEKVVQRHQLECKAIGDYSGKRHARFASDRNGRKFRHTLLATPAERENMLAGATRTTIANGSAERRSGAGIYMQ